VTVRLSLCCVYTSWKPLIMLFSDEFTGRVNTTGKVSPPAVMFTTCVPFVSTSLSVLWNSDNVREPRRSSKYHSSDASNCVDLVGLRKALPVEACRPSH